MRHLALSTVILLGLACSSGAASDGLIAEAQRTLGTNPKKAQALFEQALSQKESGAARIGLALAHERQQDWKAAEDTLLATTADAADAPAVHLALARIRIMGGNAKGARTDVAWLVGKRPLALAPHVLSVALADDIAAARDARLKLVAWAEGYARASPSEPFPAEYYAALATAHAILGNSKEAESAHRATLTAPLPSPKATTALAVLCRRLGKLSLAERLLIRATQIEPHHIGWIALIEVALDLGHLGVAMDASEQISEDNSAPKTLLIRSRLLSRTGRAPEAAAILQRGLDGLSATAVAERVTFQLALAEATAQSSGIAPAIETVSRIVGSAETKRPANIVLARLLAQAGRHGEALEKVRAAQRLGPLDAASFELLVSALMATGKLSKAESETRDRVLSLPRESGARVLRARVLQASGKSLAAADELRVALSLAQGPGAFDAVDGLVRLTMAAGDAPGALRVARAQAKLNRASPRHQLLVAELLHDDPAAALAVLQDALSANPTSARLHSALADHHERQGRGAVAIGVLERALPATGNARLLRTQLAMLHARQGRPKEAAKLYEPMANSGSVPALNNLAMLYADDLDDPARAVALAEKAVGFRGDDSRLGATLGWALHRRGHAEDREKAIRLLQEATSKGAGGMLHYHLGVVLAANGDKAEAMLALRQAIKLAPELSQAARVLRGLER